MGSTKIEQPQAPQAPSVSSSMSDYVANYPKLFELMKQYAPQEAQMALDLANQYSQPLVEAYKKAQEQLYPEETAINKQINEQIQQGISGGVPDWMKQEYLSNMQSQLGTNVGSPIGADYVSRGLLDLNKSYQDYYRNLGLSQMGRQPIYSAQPVNYTNQLGNFTPQGVMNYNASNYGNYSNLYGNMYGTNQRAASQGNWWQQGLTGIGQAGTGGLATGIGYALMMSSKRYKKNIKLWGKPSTKFIS